MSEPDGTYETYCENRIADGDRRMTALCVLIGKVLAKLSDHQLICPICLADMQDADGTHREDCALSEFGATCVAEAQRIAALEALIVAKDAALGPFADACRLYEDHNKGLAYTRDPRALATNITALRRARAALALTPEGVGERVASLERVAEVATAWTTAYRDYYKRRYISAREYHAAELALVDAVREVKP